MGLVYELLGVLGADGDHEGPAGRDAVPALVGDPVPRDPEGGVHVVGVGADVATVRRHDPGRGAIVPPPHEGREGAVHAVVVDAVGAGHAAVACCIKVS